MIRVLILEDRDTIRAALATLIGGQKDMRVIAEATNAETGVEAAAALSPDVVVMDLELPYMGGLEATRLIKAATPKVAVIAFSMHTTDDDRAEVLAAGGAALVAKDESPAVLLATIRALARPSAGAAPAYVDEPASPRSTLAPRAAPSPPAI